MSQVGSLSKNLIPSDPKNQIGVHQEGKLLPKVVANATTPIPQLLCREAVVQHHQHVQISTKKKHNTGITETCIDIEREVLGMAFYTHAYTSKDQTISICMECYTNKVKLVFCHDHLNNYCGKPFICSQAITCNLICH